MKYSEAIEKVEMKVSELGLVDQWGDLYEPVLAMACVSKEIPGLDHLNSLLSSGEISSEIWHNEWISAIDCLGEIYKKKKLDKYLNV